MTRSTPSKRCTLADGMRIVKLFLHITQDEQDKRLKERIETPWKRWKTGTDDYHNRSMRAAYLRCLSRHVRQDIDRQSRPGR